MPLAVAAAAGATPGTTASPGVASCAAGGGPVAPRFDASGTAWTSGCGGLAVVAGAIGLGRPSACDRPGRPVARGGLAGVVGLGRPLARGGPPASAGVRGAG